MKQLYLVIILAFAATLGQAQGTLCNSSGNIVIFTNYDGGILTINVNQNIPNLKIGVVSYEAVAISITGTYAGNVTEVRYAGYNANNDNCNTGTTNTSISGAGSAATSITFAPTSTLANSYGYGSIICAYSCDISTYQGGCNTVDQIESYFLSVFANSSIYMHRVQYNCWSGTQNISAGGDCCALAVPFGGIVNDTAESCAGTCDGSATASAAGGEEPYTFQWSTGATTASITNLCPGTYTLTVTDDLGATDTLEIEIDSAASISVSQYPALCDGESITVGANTYTASGSYTDTLSAANGCDSVVFTHLTVYPPNINTQAFQASECDGLSVIVGVHTYTESGNYTDTLPSSTGCDSVVITVIDLFPADLIFTQPGDETVNAGNTASFTLTPSNASSVLQWQENSGTGFVDLSDAGPYSGTHTASLSVAAVPASMNNYLYRCIVSEPLCSDTSDTAMLKVKIPSGVSSPADGGWSIYPNPASDVLHVVSGQRIAGTYTIIDYTGRVVMKGLLVHGNASINVGLLKTGMYTLLADDREGYRFSVTAK